MGPRLVCYGGCHVTGFPVGEAQSFVRRIADYFGLEQVELLGTATIRKVLQTIMDRPCAYDGDFVILQLGHYETTRSLVPRRLRKRASSSGATAGAPAPVTNLQRNDCSSVRFQGLQVAKFALLLLRDALRRPMLDCAAAERDVAQVAHALATRGATTIIVSTFPTQSWVTNIYRRRFNDALARQARRHRMVYLDAYGLLWRAHTAGRPAIFADEGHLGVEGHALLGSLLIDTLREHGLASSPQRRAAPCVVPIA